MPYTPLFHTCVLCSLIPLFFIRKVSRFSQCNHIHLVMSDGHLVCLCCNAGLSYGVHLESVTEWAAVESNCARILKIMYLCVEEILFICRTLCLNLMLYYNVNWNSTAWIYFWKDSVKVLFENWCQIFFGNIQPTGKKEQYTSCGKEQNISGWVIPGQSF